jgi:tRNA U34 5-carboxymethylaminomethyl modifying GTPase MnmE/TrmE
MSDKTQELHAELIKARAELQALIDGTDANSPDIWTDEYRKNLEKLRERFLAISRLIDLINESTHN